jgi:hypothetical protein
MLLKDCNNCQYLIRLIGIGQGVRCGNDTNQTLKKDDADKSPILISKVPDNCPFKS